MAIIKCKMCGGDLRIEEGTTVCECEYCGTRQTVPSADNEKKLTLFSRAGRLLRGCEFDKAAGVFETIVADFPEEAEAYWGLVLCKYGIEYVDDPATGKKIPTCHRSSFDSVLDDANFEQACENTDAVARRVYRDEARQIEELRQAILQVSGKEEPYDVFISYKETDANGERTLDSVIAQDIYKELTGEGYRVFFSRISLEDKLGTEYEPYIFAALNSAKVMLVVGTDYENFDSVWVKNEWSRFLKLIAAGQKKTLIPVFKNMDAYDMPKEFKKLAAQDMGKVGAMQDLLRGVEKLVGKKKAENAPAQQPVYISNEMNAKTAAAVKRGNLALEDGEFEKAKEFFDQTLTLDAECAEAYLGLALANERCRDEQEYITRACGVEGSQEMLSIAPDSQRAENAAKSYFLKNFLRIDTIRALFDYDLRYPSTVKGQARIAEQEKSQFENNKNLNRAFRFAKGETAGRLNAFKTQLYAGLDQNAAQAKEQEEAARAAKAEAYAKHLDEAEQKAVELRREAEAKRERAYVSACEAQENADSTSRFYRVIADFERFADYKDSGARIEQCKNTIRELEKQERLRKEAEAKAAAEKARAAAEEAERKLKAAEEEAERQRVLAEKAAAEKKAKQKKIGIIAGIVAAFAIATILVITGVIIPNQKLTQAIALIDSGDYKAAYLLLDGMNYKNSNELQASIKPQFKRVLLSEAQNGSYVFFGSYEQDNNTANGKEDIEWLVLAKKDDRILVISRYALDCQQYETVYSRYVTWETCSLREWLNDSFLSVAFSEEERAMIPNVTVSADKHPKYSTSPGNSTTDQAFLLSNPEANRYFNSDEARKCAPTDYAIVQGASTRYSSKVDGRATCEWWLRSPGEYSGKADFVGTFGSFGGIGAYVTDGYVAVRPALWIELTA